MLLISLRVRILNRRTGGKENKRKRIGDLVLRNWKAQHFDFWQDWECVWRVHRSVVFPSVTIWTGFLRFSGLPDFYVRGRMHFILLVAAHFSRSKPCHQTASPSILPQTALCILAEGNCDIPVAVKSHPKQSESRPAQSRGNRCCFPSPQPSANAFDNGWPKEVGMTTRKSYFIRYETDSHPTLLLAGMPLRCFGARQRDG